VALSMGGPPCSMLKGWFDVTVGGLIIFGNVVTVAPQLALLFRTKSNTGLNLWTLLLFCLSTAATVFNGLDDYWNDFHCCAIISFGQCSNILAAFYGLVTWFLGWQAIYIVALFAWPREGLSDEEKRQQRKEEIKHWVVFTIYSFFLISCIIVVVIGNTWYPKNSYFYITMDSLWGISSSVFTAAIWIPQVYTTYTLRDTGSLSILLILMNFLGTGITVYNQICYGAKYWIWIPQLIAGFFCLVLAILGSYFAYEQNKTWREFLWPDGIQQSLPDDMINASIEKDFYPNPDRE